MKDKVFIDTNLLVYAYLEDVPNKEKRQQIVKLLRNVSENIVISTQVINEFYNVLLKNKISDENIQNRIEEILHYSQLNIIDFEIIKYSWSIRKKYNFSFWDSLIISSAINSNCNILYTEDMQHNQLVDNTLTIINPFK